MGTYNTASDMASGYGNSYYNVNATNASAANAFMNAGNAITAAAAATAAVNNNNVATFQEEESQVVPESLDHLSREELCHMIYRLDYERHTLKSQVEALRRAYGAVSSSSNAREKSSNRGAEEEDEPPGKKNAAKRARSSTKGSAPQHPKASPTPPQLPAHLQEELQLAVRPPNNPNPPPSQADIDKFQKRLGKNTIALIKKAVHGGRKIPKTLCTEGNVSAAIIAAIMNSHADKIVTDTKRMTKWNFTYDRDIAQVGADALFLWCLVIDLSFPLEWSFWLS